MLSLKLKGSNINFSVFQLTKYIKIIFISLLLLLLAAGSFFVVKSAREYINNIKITGISIDGDISYLALDDVYNVVSVYNGSSFYSLNLFKLKKDLLALPWVEKVSISREWPSLLKIYVVEKEPFAIIESGGMISTKGKVFYPKHKLDLSLPIFFGNLNLMDDIIQKYFKILAYVEPLGFKIKELELMPDQGWRILIGDNLNLYLGSKDLEDRLANFSAAFKLLLSSKINEISYVDLRYTNGISVSWK